MSRSELTPARFAPDLAAIDFDDDARLAFAAEATRARDDNLLVVRSRYRQPFGRFSGDLPRRPGAGRGLGGDGEPRRAVVRATAPRAPGAARPAAAWSASPDQVAQGLGPGGDDLDGALGVDLAGQALEQRRHLLLHQRLQRLAKAQRVVDREAELLVVAAGPEARDRLDDRHVVGVVAARVGVSTSSSLQPVQHVGRAGRSGGAPRRRETRACSCAARARSSDAVLELDHRAGALGVLVEHLA